MVRSRASRDRSDAGNRSASDTQPRPHASNSTTTSTSPTAVCTPRSHGSSCSTLGAITRNKARASPSATRVHTTDDTAAPAGTPPRCTIRCTRAASPATATDRSFTAAPTRLASWATRQLWGATGFRMRCQPHPLATSDERFTANATTRSHRSAPSSAAKVTCGRVAVAVRRTEAAWDPARRVDDQLVRALELLADPARPPKVQFLVAQGVVSDLMSRRGHPAGDLREPADMLAHQEERRGHVGGREGLENWLRGAGVRAVVEGEVGHSLPGGSPAHCAPEEGAVGLVGAVRPGAESGRAGGSSDGDQHAA